MKWIVDWTITKTVPDACPDSKADPYTGEYPNFRCAEYHSKEITKPMRRVFDAQEEARAFIDGALRGMTFTLTNWDESSVEMP